MFFQPVPRKTGHWDGLFRIFIARCERKPQHLSGHLRIFVKELVKVTHAKEEDGVRVLFFDVKELVHHSTFRHRRCLHGLRWSLATPTRAHEGSQSTTCSALISQETALQFLPTS